MERREFVSVLATLGALGFPEPAHALQPARPEVDHYWAEVPPGATLWGLAVFLADEPVEFTVGAGQNVQTMRGRFDGQRLYEYSWRNRSYPYHAVFVGFITFGERITAA